MRAGQAGGSDGQVRRGSEAAEGPEDAGGGDAVGQRGGVLHHAIVAAVGYVQVPLGIQRHAGGEVQAVGADAVGVGGVRNEVWLANHQVGGLAIGQRRGVGPTEHAVVIGVGHVQAAGVRVDGQAVGLVELVGGGHVRVVRIIDREVGLTLHGVGGGVVTHAGVEGQGDR